MHFTNQFEKLTNEVQSFIKKKVDDKVTFGNPCYKIKGKYICYCNMTDEEGEAWQETIPLEEMETHILCGIADDIVEMNKNLGGQN